MRRLGGTFPGKRHCPCPFISATDNFSLSKAHCYLASALPLSPTDPKSMVTLQLFVSFRLLILIASPVPKLRTT